MRAYSYLWPGWEGGERPDIAPQVDMLACPVERGPKLLLPPEEVGAVLLEGQPKARCCQHPERQDMLSRALSRMPRTDSDVAGGSQGWAAEALGN